MTSVLYRTVERVLDTEGQFSRNKNFEAFEAPEMRRALRIVRFIKSLRKDLLALSVADEFSLSAAPFSGPPGVEGVPPVGQTQIRLVMTSLGTSRTAFLNAEEIRILRKDPAVDEILSRFGV